MKLKRLMKDLPIDWKGSKDIEITGISHHSKRVVPGHLFIARKGEKFDGWSFIDEAVNNGASAILTPQFNPFYKHIQQIVHPKPEELEPILAARFYEHPSRDITAIAVTGTNGKTTVSSLLQQWLEKLIPHPCGLIGTIEYRTGSKTYEAERTTPDSLTLQRLLREMKTAGCSYVCMEATSHGIIQGRTSEVDFKVGIFTNLNQDHLDYHGTMLEYGKAKQALFDSSKAARQMLAAVVCNDTPWGDFMVAPFKGRVIRYGRQANSDLRLIDEELHANGSRFTFHFMGKTYSAQTTLVGSHNVDNCLAAIGALSALGFDLEKSLPFLPQVHAVRGRLERVPTPWGFVYVDYSHKPDALEHTLTTLKKVYPSKRLICVFGCGGDRDRGKRPMMGEIADRLSDSVWVTSDNPRSEDPQSIIQEILSGMPQIPRASRHINVDRQQAIYQALESMNESDVLVIAGKGHETYQILGSRLISFNDVEVAREWPGFQKAKKSQPLMTSQR